MVPFHPKRVVLIMFAIAIILMLSPIILALTDQEIYFVILSTIPSIVCFVLAFSLCFKKMADRRMRIYQRV